MYLYCMFLDYLNTTWMIMCWCQQWLVGSYPIIFSIFQETAMYSFFEFLFISPVNVLNLFINFNVKTFKLSVHMYKISVIPVLFDFNRQYLLYCLKYVSITVNSKIIIARFSYCEFCDWIYMAIIKTSNLRFDTCI